MSERFTSLHIEYKSGYKYQLVTEYRCKTQIYPEKLIHTLYIDLSMAGVRTIRAGYAWDGSSGPTWDTKTLMRASLGHDADCQLLRQGYLDLRWLEQIDKEYRLICLEDGMISLRAWAHYTTLNKIDSYAKPASKKKIHFAPFDPKKRTVTAYGR